MTVFSRKCFQLLLVVVLFALSATGLLAQTNYGGVRGLVKDASGAVIPKATVKLIEDSTKVARTDVSNDVGEYLFTAVAPGNYSMVIEAPAFKKFEVEHVVVELGAIATVDAAMVPGSVAEMVEVTSAAPLIDTASASEGQLFNEQQLQDLPNLGRNPFVFDKLDNNVTAVGDPRFVRAEDQSGTSSVSVAGAPIGANNYAVDGIPISTSSGGVTFIPSLEAVSDAKVQANTYDSEVGRTGGGLFNTSLKYGSSTYHGTLYGETRQTPWTANSWFYNNNFYSSSTGAQLPPPIPRPDQTTYLYAGAFGGPLLPFNKHVKFLDNTFYWVTEEGYRQAQPYTSTTTSYFVPTLAEAGGDFSADPGVTLYDPTSPFVGGKHTATLPGNKIPSAYINPIGQAIVNAFPKPTTASAYGAAQFNFYGSNDFKTRSDMYSGKVDHVFKPWYTASASYVHLATQEPNGSILNVFAESNGVIHRFNDATAVNNTFTLSPTMLLTIGYGFNRYYSDTLQYSSGFNQTNGFNGAGFPQGFVSQLQSATYPTITLSGVTNAASIGAATSGPTIQYSRNLVVGLSKTLGKHTLKTGYVFRTLGDWVSSASGGNGSYTFNGQYSTQTGAAPSSSSAAIADLLMGLPSAASVTINAYGLNMLEHYNAVYLQDDYRVDPKLTLNIGLRYEYELGQREQTNRYNVGFTTNATYTFPSAAAPAASGGLLFAGVGGAPVHCCDETHKKFAPRVGAAYQITKDTVVRAGFGVFFAPVGLTPYSTGFSQITAYSTSTPTAPVAVGTGSWLSNPFPSGLLTPTGSSLGLLTGTGGPLTLQGLSRRYPLVDQYSLDAEHQFPHGVVLKVGYVGAHSRNIANSTNINQLPDSVLASYAGGTTSLASNVTNPYYAKLVGGYPSTGVISNTNIKKGQSLLPYPQFTTITEQISNGFSNYNALDVKVQKRMSFGLTVLATYTWSSNWDNLWSASDSLNTNQGPQDYTNPNGEYSRAINDMRNRATAAVTYQLPFGKGKAFLGGANRWVDEAVGGWQISDEWVDQNGSPIAVIQTDLSSGTYGTTGVGGNVQRPNLVAGMNPCYSGRPQSRLGIANHGGAYINAAAFSPAAPYTYGNAPRTLPCTGPGYDNSDISLNKSIKIGDKLNIQFRAEALNAFNTPEFGSPNPTLTVSGTGINTAPAPASGASQSLGVVNSQLGFSRIIQLGGRITF